MQNLFHMSHINYRDICLRLKRPSVEAWPARFHARPLETQPHALNFRLGLDSFLEGHSVFLSGGIAWRVYRESNFRPVCAGLHHQLHCHQRHGLGRRRTGGGEVGGALVAAKAATRWWRRSGGSTNLRLYMQLAFASQ